MYGYNTPSRTATDLGILNSGALYI